MTHTVIQTNDAPQAIGPYSQARRSGNLLFTSGQIALDPVSGAMVSDDIEGQSRQVLKNLAAVLAAGGAQLTDVIKTTIFVKDLSHFAQVNQIYADFFGAHKPARSTVEVSRLPKDALVEIEAIAVSSNFAPESRF